MWIAQVLTFIAMQSHRLSRVTTMHFARLTALGNRLTLKLLIGATRNLSRLLRDQQTAASTINLLLLGSIEVAWALFCLILAMLLICKDYGWLPWLVATSWGHVLAPLAIILPLLPILDVYEHAAHFWKTLTHLAGCQRSRNSDGDFK